MRCFPLISRFVLQVVSLVTAITCSSQPKTSVGLNLTGELASSSDFVIGFGGTFETQFGKHHGIETGLYYRPFKIHSQIYMDGALFASYTMKEMYLAVPVLYKYHSPVLNASFGPTFNVYTGTKKGKVSIPLIPTIGNHTPEHKFQLGLLAKISKTIGITKYLFIEPEIRYNPTFYYRRSYYSAGITLKYALVK